MADDSDNLLRKRMTLLVVRDVGLRKLKMKTNHLKLRRFNESTMSCLTQEIVVGMRVIPDNFDKD